MKTKQQGIVLLITLILMTITSCLLILQMNGNTLAYKLLNQKFQYQKNWYLLKAEAIKLAKLLPKDWSSRCIVSQWSNIDIFLEKACLWKNEQATFYYLVEDLEVVPCLQVIEHHLTYSTHHFRITVTDSLKDNLLQIRVALPISLIPCPTKNLIISSGILSQRSMNRTYS